MTISIVYLVKGMLDENTRPEFIGEIKEVVDKGLKLGSQSTGVILHELDPDSMCATSQKMITLYVYTVADKSIDDKAEMIKLASELFDQRFGNRGEGQNVVIIKEHTSENYGVSGEMYA